jgi:Na+-driven multidrug efflux pump
LQLIAIKVDRHRPFEHFSFRTAPDKQRLFQILKWSVPIGIESMFFTVLTMVTSRFVAAFGADAIAVSRVGSQIESLSWLIGGGFGSALTAFMGQNYGAGKWFRIRRCFKIASVTMLVWGVIITLLLTLAAPLLFSVFIKESHIIEMGATYLRILSFCQIAMCLESVSSGSFKGIGKTLEPSVVSITSNALRVPLSYFLSKTSLGLNGIWIGVCLGAVLRGAWSYIWYLIVSRRLPTVDDTTIQKE